MSAASIAKIIAKWIDKGYPEEVGERMGGAALPVAAGLPAAGQSDDAEAGFITKGGKTLLEAFHGSPHKFDKFSMDQIGTGEGAQAYGHGLYFTDTEDIAKQYRDTLSLNGYQDNNANYGKALEFGLSAGEFDAFESMVRGGATRGVNSVESLAPMLQKHLQWPDEHLPSIERFVGEYLDTLPKGSLYRTEIDVTPESLLDWDKPLGEQSEAVAGMLDERAKDYDEIGSLIFNHLEDPERALRGDASTFYDELSHLAGSSEQASQLLSDRGIKGIKYLDGGSRHPTQAEADIANEIRDLEKNRELGLFMQGTDGVRDLSGGIKSLDDDIASRRQALKEMEAARQSSNYVIFDDSLINIAERGNADVGLLSLLASGSAGAGVLLNSLFAEAERAKK